MQNELNDLERVKSSKKNDEFKTISRKIGKSKSKKQRDVDDEDGGNSNNVQQNNDSILDMEILKRTNFIFSWKRKRRKNKTIQRVVC